MPAPTVKELIGDYAAKYGVSHREMEKVIDCETGGTFDSKIQSMIPDRSGPHGQEDSWGLSQIHLPDWPGVTKKQAQDPNFALNFMASQFSQGHKYFWSCYKILKARGTI